MQIRIRPLKESWHPGYEYQWQPLDSQNGTWYHIWSKNISRFPYGDAQLRRQAAIETCYTMNALLQGVPVQVRASYDKQARKLYILEHNGHETTH